MGLGLPGARRLMQRVLHRVHPGQGTRVVVARWKSTGRCRRWSSRSPTPPTPARCAARRPRWPRRSASTRPIAAGWPLVATELGTNLVKHAGGLGKVLLRGLAEEGAGGRAPLHRLRPGILGRSSPPGWALERRDAGRGPRGGAASLGRARHLVRPGRGSILVARVLARVRPGETSGIHVAMGAVCVPLAGESISGDLWATQRVGGRLRVIVVDGLGHGRPAAVAARTAVEAFQAGGRSPLKELLESVHQALRATRERRWPSPSWTGTVAS